MSKTQYNLKDLYEICITKEFIESKIDYKTFSTIIREFNIQISNEILKGYKFKPGNNLGTFNIIKDIRREKSINWKESNKYKAWLIERNRVPYDKELAQEGEPWLIYYTDNTYYKWKWFKDVSTKYVKNINNFIFKAVTANRRNISKIVKEDNFIPENYVTYK